MKPAVLISVALFLLPFPPSLRAADPGAPIPLFDGKSLGQWNPVSFGGEGAVTVENGEMRLGQGSPMTGVVWKGPVPAVTNYELSLDAKKVNGNDFFLALTFPVNGSHCSFVVGGWGGGVVGISSINHLDASENETTTFASFDEGKWYSIRVCVRPGSISCSIDGKTCVDVDISAGAKIGMRFGEIEMCMPLGMAAYDTSAAYRNIVWRPLPPLPAE